MKRSSVAHLNCSIAQTLEVVGEWWTPLVLRNISMGQLRFEALQSALGIARNILSDRLTTLVENGVLTRVKYQDHPERYEYHLTDKGRDLWVVLAALMAWGDRWAAPYGAPVVLEHVDCGKACRPMFVCDQCHEPLTLTNVRSTCGPGWKAPTGAPEPEPETAASP